MGRRRKPNKLNDSINIPMRREFKKQIVEAAEQADCAPTKYARDLLEAAMGKVGVRKELVTAK